MLVRLAEAVPVTGGLTLDLLSIDGAALKQAGSRGGKYTPRKPAQSKARSEATKRKLTRKPR